MKRLLLLFVIVIINVGIVFAQQVDNKKLQDVKYRRSSLHTILMESDIFPYKDTVIGAYYKAPFPEKYNNHTVGEKSFDPKQFGINGDTSSTNIPVIIENYLKQKKVANQMVAKWFNRQEDGAFDMSLIGERGSYNASEMEARVADKTARGTTSLADAGEELIGNTFVVVSKLFFLSNEGPAYAALLVSRALTNNMSGMAKTIAEKVADIAYKKAREGYSVWTTSYLYKLQWNDSISSIFYNDYWMDKNSIDPAKKEKFDNSELFSLQFIGSEKSRSLVTGSFKEQRGAEKLVEMATIRTIDNVYSKLQKKYDVFKTKTPLLSGEPITAEIGLKEGLESGDRFEVLEQTIDKEGKTKYVRKGVIKVDGKQIWDNRYAAGQEPGTDSTQVSKKPILKATTFKGGKDLYPGLLIRQIK
ncbi:MAG: hypothetical protein EHM93_18925 [Bacteroidales bacterium]|nr:MAG: hypothetical protein EHM93_18925 [Bacteroidales bacterium]